MKTLITKIEVTPIRIKLTEPFVISKGALTHAKNTVIKIYINEELYGVGECCPYRTIHGETQQGTVAAGRDLADMLVGMDATQIRKCIRAIDKNLAGNASIKGAFDMALYDLNAKLVGLPLYKYLQGDNDKIIHTDMTVSLLSEQDMAQKALKFQNDGFPVLKIKLGESPSRLDVSRIHTIRKAIGDDMPLRIDANQGWNYLTAQEVLNNIADYGIQHCEAPLPSGNFIDLVKLNSSSPIPIMGDESVFSHHDAYRMLAADCISLINIKLGKSGGICHAMKIASIAQAAGVYCQVGSFSETRVGITALTHFSMVWDNIIHYDLDSPLMQSEDPVMGGMTYHPDWHVTVTEDPGHGADFDPVFLKQFDTLTIT